MYDGQPIFNIIDSSNLQDRRELKLVLIHTENAYRSSAQRSLIASQRSWINFIINTDVPIDPAKDEVVKCSRKVACCPDPTDIPFDILNVSLLYVYCSFQEMRRYAQQRFYDGVSDGGAVISTVPPYAEGITKQTMRLWQKKVWQNTSKETHDLDAYIALLPNLRFKIQISHI
uniref:Uncharacterized protein 1 n=1 Tax=Agrobacterium tumefaciens (strain Ach5) TaxID=176298 RepID=YP1_AGRT4|nr:RolB family protein [Agrobacterium tumefaciens]P04028.2 RecName: Full=Uncharacterized protein 1; AltName: Full=Gene 5 protein [Agrobacterium tumefaciens (strain Ach5)]AAF77120.1 gene 5 protein [Agrobacterium tumefaciens]CAA25163.1 unnamed protein product [Agrobacterium tumefaciens]